MDGDTLELLTNNPLPDRIGNDRHTHPRMCPRELATHRRAHKKFSLASDPTIKDFSVPGHGTVSQFTLSNVSTHKVFSVRCETVPVISRHLKGMNRQSQMSVMRIKVLHGQRVRSEMVMVAKIHVINIDTESDVTSTQIMDISAVVSAASDIPV